MIGAVVDPVFAPLVALTSVIALAFMAHAYWSSDVAKLRRAMKAVPKAPIADVRGGVVAKVVGRVRLIGQPLRAPLSGRRCVHFEVIVEHQSGAGTRGDWE